MTWFLVFQFREHPQSWINTGMEYDITLQVCPWPACPERTRIKLQFLPVAHYPCLEIRSLLEIRCNFLILKFSKCLEKGRRCVLSSLGFIGRITQLRLIAQPSRCWWTAFPLTLVLPRYFLLIYICYQRGHYDPLWKLVIKHPTFIKVVPGNS